MSTTFDTKLKQLCFDTMCVCLGGSDTQMGGNRVLGLIPNKVHCDTNAYLAKNRFCFCCTNGWHGCTFGWQVKRMYKWVYIFERAAGSDIF